MTCIIGYKDEQNNCVYIGGDSCSSNGQVKNTVENSKVFRNRKYNDVIIGSTSTWRHIDILKYSDIFNKEYHNIKVDHKYLVMVFIPKIIRLFKEGVPSFVEEERGGNFIIGIKDKLFEVQKDYSILEHTLPFCSVGSGEEVAMGSLLTTQGLHIPIAEKIFIALRAAEKYNVGVQAPFVLMSTKEIGEIILLS